MRNQVEPLIYNEDNETLQPKHDVIAELFFLFHKDTVSINRLMERVINEMNNEETEILLDQMVDKTEFLRGSVYGFDIRYQDYMSQIQKRIKSGRIVLGSGGRANLCTGHFWLKLQQMLRRVAKGAESSEIEVYREEIEAYLSENAPTMESFVRGEDFFGINFHGMARLYTEWGMWEERIGNPVKAEQRLKDVLTMGAKEETLFARTVLGRFLAKRQRNEEAISVLQQALEIEPDNIYVLRELGRLLARQSKQEEEAEAILNKALKISSDDALIWMELGRLLARQQERETDAKAAFQEALKIDPDNVLSRVMLAKLYEKQRKFSDAEKLYQEVCRIDPGNRRAKEGVARMRWLKKYRHKSLRWEE